VRGDKSSQVWEGGSDRRTGEVVRGRPDGKAVGGRPCGREGSRERPCERSMRGGDARGVAARGVH
jgi:hypothetical protein